METQEVRHRPAPVRDDLTGEVDAPATKPNPTGPTPPSTNDAKSRHDRLMAMAKRGLRSLLIAVGVPLILTISTIYLFGGSQGSTTTASYKVKDAKVLPTPTRGPNWVPPLWALHATCLASATLMGLASWLFWAEGGVRRRPDAVYLYLAQMLLGLAWNPVVYRGGGNWAGLGVAVAVFGMMWRCSRVFGEVSRTAGDLVKPCLAWAGLLAFVNLKLILAGGRL